MSDLQEKQLVKTSPHETPQPSYDWKQEGSRNQRKISGFCFLPASYFPFLSLHLFLSSFLLLFPLFSLFLTLLSCFLIAFFFFFFFSYFIFLFPVLLSSFLLLFSPFFLFFPFSSSSPSLSLLFFLLFFLLPPLSSSRFPSFSSLSSSIFWDSSSKTSRHCNLLLPGAAAPHRFCPSSRTSGRTSSVINSIVVSFRQARGCPAVFLFNFSGGERSSQRDARIHKRLDRRWKNNSAREIHISPFNAALIFSNEAEITRLCFAPKLSEAAEDDVCFFLRGKRSNSAGRGSDLFPTAALRLLLPCVSSSGTGS